MRSVDQDDTKFESPEAQAEKAQESLIETPEASDSKRISAQTNALIQKKATPLDKEKGGFIINVEDFVKLAKSPQEAERIRENFKDLTCVDLADPESKVFADSMRLYEYAFPNSDEREDSELIAERIKSMQNITPELQERYGDRRFHAIAIVNKENQVVGYAQFSVLPFGGEKDKVVAYGQYVAAADEEFMQKQYEKPANFRRKGVYGALSMVGEVVSSREAAAMDYKNGFGGGYIESEMLGQAEDPDDIRFTSTRLDIHASLGFKALVLELEDGQIVNLHMQPKLSEDSQPVQLLMLYRPDNYLSQPPSATIEIDKEIAASLEESFLQSLTAEGFDAKSIEEAREALRDKISRTKRAVLMPVREVPDITKLAQGDPSLAAQIERDYGCTPEEHLKKVKKALKTPQRKDA